MLWLVLLAAAASSQAPASVALNRVVTVADLNGQYSMRYESESGPEGELKVEIRRQDTRSRVGRSVAEVATMQ